MYKAKDIMSTPVTTVNESDSLQDALQTMATKRFSGIPVTNDEGKVVGIISDTDIIKYSQKVSVIPHTNLSGWISPYADITDLASMRKGYDLLNKTKIGQVMTKKVYTVHEGVDTVEVAKLMNRRNINRVPVVDSADKLIGIITRADMVQCMAKL